jgi:hypothetical protein
LIRFLYYDQCIINSDVVQWLEYEPHELVVRGSIPRIATFFHIKALDARQEWTINNRLITINMNETHTLINSIEQLSMIHQSFFF